MADRTDRQELLITEDDINTRPWICDGQVCDVAINQPFCAGPCVVTSGSTSGITVQQTAPRDVVQPDFFGGQPALFSFDLWFVDAPDAGRTLTINSTVDLGRTTESYSVTVPRTNVSQHVHHDLTIPNGYDTHGISATLFIQESGSTVNTPYTLYIDNLSLVFYYPPGEYGTALAGTTLRGHERAEYTASLAANPTAGGDGGGGGGGGGRVNIGAIVGGSLAGVLVIGLALILFSYYMNRKKLRFQKRLSMQPGTYEEGKPVLDPMSPPGTAQSAYYATKSQQQHQPFDPSIPHSATIVSPYPNTQQQQHAQYVDHDLSPPSYEIASSASPTTTSFGGAAGAAFTPPTGDRKQRPVGDQRPPSAGGPSGSGQPQQ